MQKLMLADNSDFEVFPEGEEDSIPAHKFVLAARSGLFRQMFQDVAEQSQAQGLELNPSQNLIHDCEFETGSKY